MYPKLVLLFSPNGRKNIQTFTIQYGAHLNSPRKHLNIVLHQLTAKSIMKQQEVIVFLNNMK